MINTQSLKHRFMALKFAIWELHLYLDTHPEDKEKLCLLNSYKEKYHQMLREYERNYGALSAKSENQCNYINTPFPWVRGGDC